MPFSRKVLVLSLLALLAFNALCLPNATNAASVKSTGTMEVLLNEEQTIIVGEKYEYTLELINLDNCDKEISTDFSCIPTIAVTIKQLDIETKEIADSETLEHMNFGVHDLNILYDDVTIVSLNVLNIAVVDGKAKIEVAYKSNVAETNILEIAARDNINANKSESYVVELTISNNSDSIIETELVIDEMASAQYVVIDNQELSRGDTLPLTLQPGDRTISLTFVPIVEGHYWLSVTIEDVQKRIPVLVHSSTSTSSNILYVSKMPFTEIMKDDKIVFDIKMDSAYLLGFSFLLLVFGGVLGFIRSGGAPPPIV